MNVVLEFVLKTAPTATEVTNATVIQGTFSTMTKCLANVCSQINIIMS